MSKKAILCASFFVIVAGNLVFNSRDMESLAADGRINDDVSTTFKQEYPRAAVSRYNYAVACWQDDRAGLSRIYAQRYGQKGMPVQKNQQITPFNNAAGQYRPDIAIDDLGHYVIVWEERGDSVNIYARVYAANAAAWTPILRVSEHANTASSTCYPAVAMDQSGNFVVVWKDRFSDPSGDILAQRFDRLGQKLGGNFRVHSTILGPQDRPDIAMGADGNFIIVWEDGRDVHQPSHEYQIYAHLYRADGTEVAGEFKVSGHPGGTLLPGYPSVTVQSNGNCFACWQYGNPVEIYGHLLNSSGETLKGDFKLSALGGSEPAGDNLHPRVCAAPGLSYAVLWDSDRGSGSDIYLKTFDASGTQFGGYLRLNETPGNQIFGDLAISQLGLLAAVWTDDRNGNPDIYGTSSVLQVPGNVVAGSGFRNRVPITWDHLYGKENIKRYKIWRSTGPSSPLVLLTTVDLSTRGNPAWVTRDYIDETAVNGQPYLYRIEAEDPLSQGPSGWVGAAAAEFGNTLNCKWAVQAPAINGVIDASEWSDAQQKVISSPYAPIPVRLYLKNNDTHLFIAVDDPNDLYLDAANAFSMGLDLNHDQKWDPSPSRNEGILSINNSANDIAYMSGSYPDDLHPDLESFTGITKSISAASGHVQYEIMFDLKTSPLRATAGSTIGAFIMITDPGNHYFDHYGASGEWPYGFISVAAESFGDLTLAESAAADTTANPNAILVTNTGDSGPGSLRQAIIDANVRPGGDYIDFHIPLSDPGYDAASGTWTIRPLTHLTELHDDGTVIDGWSQKKYAGLDTTGGPPVIVLEFNASIDNGIIFSSSNNKLLHLNIHSARYTQILVGGHSNKIWGCYIGLDAAGIHRTGIGDLGILLNGGYGHEIGGPRTDQRNVISGLNSIPISVERGSRQNLITNNFIGLNGAGSDTLGNSSGVCLFDGSNRNTIGPGNIISGNQMYGIAISKSDSNTIVGNYIGVDPGGARAWGNFSSGVYLSGGSSYNIIGGSTMAERNVISGNQYGVQIYNNASSFNRVSGNYIGTDRSGNLALPNRLAGISLAGGSSNIIGGNDSENGNVISGNGQHGVEVVNSTAATLIAYNKIGVTAEGTTSLPNHGHGILLAGGAHQNVLGPDNLIANNESFGIMIQGSATIQNIVTHNSIYRNTEGGIKLAYGNQNLPAPVINGINPVHGTAPANSQIEIFASPDDQGKTYQAVVIADAGGQFNWVGSTTDEYLTATATDAAGNTSEFSNAYSTRQEYVVTNTSDDGPGSLRQAIEDAEHNPLANTIIFRIPESDPGYSASQGTWTIHPLQELPLSQSDLLIDGHSQARFIGRDANPQGPEIILDGLQCPDYYGLMLVGNNTRIDGLSLCNFTTASIYISGNNNTVSGCLIGPDPTGYNRTKQSNCGIGIYGGNYNAIGGEHPEDRNVISGLQNTGIFLTSQAHSNTILGNYIGLNAEGSDTLGNGDIGINVGFGSKHNVVGPGNVISGNRIGIHIEMVGTDSNTVIGNLIGTDAGGSQALGNKEYGIQLFNAADNLIGGETAEARNIISGNAIGIDSEYDGSLRNRIIGNYIGTDLSGTQPLPNTSTGITIKNSPKDHMIGPDNLIAYSPYGIEVMGGGTDGNTITRNRIHSTTVKGIWIHDSGNQSLMRPELSGYHPLTGSTVANATVEIFSGPDEDGMYYEATVTADGDGRFSWPGTVMGDYVTATATDPSGNTSEFSQPLETTVAARQGTAPNRFALLANFPNPFNPQTQIAFDLPEPSQATLTIFDLRGQRIRILADGREGAGQHTRSWDGRDDRGAPVASGVYFYQLQARSLDGRAMRFAAVRKMLFIK